MIQNTEGSGHGPGTTERLEGILLAHRQIIAMMLARAAETHPGLLEHLDDRTTARDGQEDPGAVPTEGVAMELALAEEMTRIRNIIEVLRGS